jgi:hypothetical protein
LSDRDIYVSTAPSKDGYTVVTTDKNDRPAKPRRGLDKLL